MSKVAGQLLWNRKKITIPANTTTLNVDTGLTQVNLALSDPPLGDGIVASRVQVIPLAPLAGWANIIHAEPFLDPATNTVHVVFTYDSEQGDALPFNVLFWDPHTIIGPGEAMTYNPPIQ